MFKILPKETDPVETDFILWLTYLCVSNDTGRAQQRQITLIDMEKSLFYWDYVTKLKVKQNV